MEKFDLKLGYDITEDEENYLFEIKADPEIVEKIRSMGLTTRQVKDNLGKILAYKEDRDYCKNCPGLDACAKERPGYIFDLYLAANGYLERTLGPCALSERQSALDGNFLYRDYSPAWNKADLNPAEWGEVNRKKLLKTIDSTLDGKGTPFVYLTGEEGAGKSYLAAVLCNYYAEKDHKVAYLDVGRRMDEIGNSYFRNRNAFTSLLNELVSVDLLCLDGFGSEYISEPMRDAFYTPLLHARKEGAKATIIISDYQTSEIASLYAGKNPAKGKKLAELIKAGATEIKLTRSVHSIVHQR